MLPLPQSKDEVIRAFHELLAQRKKLRSQISTKEEIALDEERKELVKTASQHTSDVIVKGLADLQLELGESLDTLSQKLKDEISKLEEIKSSIAYEKDHLQELDHTKVAADALFILKKEQEALWKNFEEERTQKFEELEGEISKKRKNWEKELKEFESRLSDQDEQTQHLRGREKEDYSYELGRTQKIEIDQFAELKKLLERELAETELKKQKNWSKREKHLTQNEEKFNEYKSKVDNFEEELDEAKKKARDEAIKEASRAAKVKADLLAKEMEGNQQVFEMQIQTLEDTISKQQSQLEKLQAELKAAQSQVQNLSVRAFEGNKEKNEA